MRITFPRFFALSALLLAPTIPLHAQVNVSAAATPPANRPADSDGLLAYPDAPAGFNVRREGIPQGEHTVVEYDSKSVGARREMGVYLPPGYNKDRKYPVLYMLHGLGNTRTAWTHRAKAPEIVDNLLADGKIQPFIMVFPNTDAANTVANPANGSRAQTGYGEPFTKDLRSFIHARPVRANSVRRVVVGHDEDDVRATSAMRLSFHDGGEESRKQERGGDELH